MIVVDEILRILDRREIKVVWVIWVLGMFPSVMSKILEAMLGKVCLLATRAR